MAYITQDEYQALYGDAPDGFPILATQASDVIDIVTGLQGDLSTLPCPVRTLVKKATAAQVLYYSQAGMESVLSGESGGEFTVGKVHVGASISRTDKNYQAATQQLVSPYALALLQRTGLLERSVSCFDPFHSDFFGMW